MTPDVLTAHLAEPAPLPLDRISLFLDIDGTLAAFEASPDLVRPMPRRTALLHGLATALDGRLAAVSGRDLGAIDYILDGATPAASGVHGLERRRADGAVERTPPHPALAVARAEAQAFAAAHPGVLVEDKALAVAIHYRRAPDSAAAVKALANRLASHGLALQPGHMVVEMKTPGADKGQSVRTFMSEAPFTAHRPVFVGDDVTDESAFEAVAGLGGFGVLVGPPRATAARYRLEGVEQVLSWLEQSLEAA